MTEKTYDMIFKLLIGPAIKSSTDSHYDAHQAFQVNNQQQQQKENKQ